MPARKPLTIADIAALAICPTLVVLLLTSLVYFLILCLYRGEFTARLVYILFMFIVGATGIARITVESGRAHAALYAFALGTATVFVLSRFSNPLFAVLIVAIVWLIADRVTFDCTVIDDDQRSGGEGLLGAGGLFGGHRQTPATNVAFDGTTAAGDSPTNDTRDASRRRSARPGRSVLWLAFGSLPLFGLGQLVLSSDPTLLAQASKALAGYLFATFMLLVTTSFLELRAYLRKRGSGMPAGVTSAWLVGGVALIATLLAAAYLLPIPGHALAKWQPSLKIRSPDDLDTSRFGWGQESPTPQEPATDEWGTAAEEHADEPETDGSQEGASGSPSEAKDQSSTSADSANTNQRDPSTDEGPRESAERHAPTSQTHENGQQDDRQANEQTTSDSESAGGDPDSKSPPSAEPPTPASQPPRPWTSELAQFFSLLLSLAKWILVAALCLILLWAGYQNRQQLAIWWQRLLAFFNGHDKTLNTSAATGVQAATKPRPRSFASLVNPFRRGKDNKQVVILAFESLECWANDHGLPRLDHESATEFVQRFSNRFRPPGNVLGGFLTCYNATVYGGLPPQETGLDATRQLWNWLTQNQRTNRMGTDPQTKPPQTESPRQRRTLRETPSTNISQP